MRKTLKTIRSMAFAVLGLAFLPGLAAAQACPDPSLPPLPGDQANASLATGMNLNVVAGGNLDLSSCMDVPGTGFVAQAADYELTVDGNVSDDLQISVNAPCDAILLVNDSTGTWHFSDDEDGGMLPRIVIPAAPNGVFDIWVGTYDGASCESTLTLQTFAAGTTAPTSADTAADPTAELCPDIGFDAPILAYDIGMLATPQVTSVVAGGDTDLGQCPDVPGSGWIVRNPDFQMDLTGNTGQDVVVQVDAVCDAILLINDATGTWQYNDDTDGTNPVITLGAAQDGAYDIWVGTLGPDNCEATLTISSAGAGQPTKGQPPVSTAAPDPGNLTSFREMPDQVFTFSVTGAVDGPVYGTEIYTDDSDLSTAAVHAGLLSVGQTADVTVQITGPQKAFTASTQNGVESMDYGRWDGSFVFIN